MMQVFVFFCNGQHVIQHHVQTSKTAWHTHERCKSSLKHLASYIRWSFYTQTSFSIQLQSKASYASTKTISTHSLVKCTPPLNPVSKCPLPRPPARICALITYSRTSGHINSVQPMTGVCNIHCNYIICTFLRKRVLVSDRYANFCNYRCQMSKK